MPERCSRMYSWRLVPPAAEHERLKRRDRRAVRAETLTEQEIALIDRAEVPAECAHGRGT
jgi:hypothetical protein